MKCLFLFKERKSNKERKSDSAPELRETNRSKNEAFSSRSMPSPRSIPELYKKKEQNLRVFSLQELAEATRDFHRMFVIGEGGFGRVYKGMIKPPTRNPGKSTVVAIKKLNQHSLQGHKEWLAEVHFLGVVSHPNLVKLIGYCSVDGERGIQRMLIYEYMPNKSLEDHLFKRTFPVLPFINRLQIMLGAAEGLAYLHDGLEVQVIYRDFKSSNVLLDEKFKPKLSDFGLAREGPTGDNTHVSTAVVGTYGYAAPEYVDTGHLTTHSDTWSFGVVLYEILTGRRSLERNRPTAEQKLLSWVSQYPPDSKRFSMIMDPRLRNDFSPKAARMVARLADRCLNKNAKDRPAMAQIVESLNEVIHESQTNGPSLASSSSSSSSSAAHSNSIQFRPNGRPSK